MDAEKIAALAKALAHPARVQIVELLARQRECRAADVFAELPLAQSTISEHVRILKEAGIVSASPVGTRALYCLDPEALGLLRDAVALIVGQACCVREDCSDAGMPVPAADSLRST